ncbi:MAG: co-chaperone GroES family protein [Bacteroidetes bacterium]|nr:co-chaperone GroES family protein [Bacteroidota bacterium]
MGELIMVGDRVLVTVDEGERKTNAGLVLPASVAEKERVQSGRVISTGPGYVTPNPEFSEGEMWAQTREAIRYLPLQARPGDQVFFLRKEAIEIEFEGKSFLIIPHAAILALARSHVDDILQNLGSLDELDHSDDSEKHH